MIIEHTNPGVITLQVQALDLLGQPKTNITTARVRVYRVNASGQEENLLNPMNLTAVGSEGFWRYNWIPGTVSEGLYYAEYTLIDSDGVKFVGVEEIVVKDFARQQDLAFVKKIESGRWKIMDNKMYFYDEDKQTPLLVFELRDINGVPTMVNVFERNPL